AVLEPDGPASSRTSRSPATLTTSTCSPNAGVPKPPGVHRRPKRPVAWALARATTWTATQWRTCRVESNAAPAMSAPSGALGPLQCLGGSAGRGPRLLGGVSRPFSGGPGPLEGGFRLLDLLLCRPELLLGGIGL